ncbi:MAG TPA: CoA transferase, partial [Acidimicrobiales bacterium]|nr:CoA transferase [Acidimicrobiales bacterium]
RISAMEDHQWRGVVTAMGSPAWADRFATVEARIEAPEEIDQHVAAWAATRTKREAETELQANGVPATAVYSPGEILDSPQLTHRQAFEPLPVGGGREAKVVGLPFRIVAGGNEVAPERRKRRSLRGLRVLEASRVLAVPLAGAILGALGAQVTKLEDLPRLDMYRRRGPYIEGEPGMERSAYFALMNHSKASAAFDVDAARDRLDALVGSSDVVIENFGRKRAGALGLSASVGPAAHLDLLAVSSSGFGQDGPYADYRAYAYNLQASGALGFLTRNLDGESAEIDIAWADLISAFGLATIIAAWAVGPAGNAGAGIDFSMTDLIVAHFNDYLAAASLDRGIDDADRANELAPFTPNGVYPATDGWLAISVAGDEQYARLVEALGEDAFLSSDFASVEGRTAHRRELDALLAETTARHAAGNLAAALRRAGVFAEEVLDAGDLVQDTQLATRECFVPVEHPEWGRKRLFGLPWRPYGGRALRLGTPPLLGGETPVAP